MCALSLDCVCVHSHSNLMAILSHLHLHLHLHVLVILLLLVIVLLDSSSSSSQIVAGVISDGEGSTTSSNRRVVSSLPGFPGFLPFHLETGYISIVDDDDSTTAEMFYYFFKSQRNPKDDPLLLWLTGGPGCTSFTAVVYEIGPLYFDVEAYNGSGLPTLVLNPNSWTKIANIIFLDAPVGTGFSYSRTLQGSSKTGDKKSAMNSYKFLRKWLNDEHPEFLSNTLYISGDSYSGMIIPIIVQELISDIEAEKKPVLNFQGYSLGNPITDRQLEKNSVVPFAHGMGLISEELYESMRENCKGGHKYVKIDLKNVNCSKDLRQLYENCISGIFRLHILEPICASESSSRSNEDVRNRRRFLVNTSDLFLSQLPPIFPGCRNYNYMLAYYWANDHRVQKALHVRKGTVNEWLRCNTNLPYEYDVETSIDYHRNLSMKGYSSLIYSGDHDMLATHVSTEAWIRSLSLSITDDWRPWLVNGQIAGYTRTYSSGLTYATVKGGGHTAPEYKPEECFAMFERWLSQKPL